MSDRSIPSLDLRLERAAPRARRFLAPRPAGSAESTGQEGAGPRLGMPDEEDARLIARKLRQAAPAATSLAGRDAAREADALAGTLVARARDAMLRLLGGAVDGALGAGEAQALEAVLHMRGRPALRVEGPRLESLDPVKHPGSEIWRSFLDDHEAALARVAGSTGAVRVRDRLAGATPWVQGSAWLAGGDRVVTNRHVLFPPPGGQRLARRRPGEPTAARLREQLEVQVDFAFDNGSPRAAALNVVEILYVSEEADPVDVAVLRLAVPMPELRPPPLILARTEFDADQLYVVGHPGRIATDLVPEAIQAVFGSPDERKRVSLGELMDPLAARPHDLVHDASTIGGYSGGCVLGLLTQEVAGLHYYGDPESGNRAVLSTALLAHPVARFFSAE